MEPAGLELVPAKPKPEHPAPECVFFVVGYSLFCGGFFLRQCLMAHRKAELYVCFDLARVGGAVEKPELHRAFGEGRMQVQPVVPCFVVMLRPAAAGACVPDVL